MLTKVTRQIEKRDKVYESRTERWQASRTGDNYQEQTADLEDIKCFLEEAEEASRNYIKNHIK